MVIGIWLKEFVLLMSAPWRVRRRLTLLESVLECLTNISRKGQQCFSITLIYRLWKVTFQTVYNQIALFLCVSFSLSHSPSAHLFLDKSSLSRTFYCLTYKFWIETQSIWNSIGLKISRFKIQSATILDFVLFSQYLTTIKIVKVSLWFIDCETLNFNPY